MRTGARRARSALSAGPPGRGPGRRAAGVGVLPGPRGCVLPHTEGPWGPRGVFVLALAAGGDEVSCRRELTELLRAPQGRAAVGDDARPPEPGTATAVAWGDEHGLSWQASGNVFVMILGRAGQQVLRHPGPGETAGREHLRPGDVVVVASGRLVEGLGADHITAQLVQQGPEQTVTRVLGEADRQGIEGPHALLACVPAGTRQGPAHEPGRAVQGPRRTGSLIWGAVGALCVIVAAFVYPRFARDRGESDAPLPADAPTDTESSARDSGWRVFEEYPAGEEIWRFRAGKAITSSPLCMNGRVYVGSRDGHLYCLSGPDGTTVWKFAAGGGIGSSPCASGGAVFVGSYDRGIYSVDEATGQERWRTPTGGQVRASPATWEGIVFCGSEDSCFYAMDAETGRVRWKWPTQGSIWARPVVAGEQVLVGSTDGVLHCYDARSGAPVWEHVTPDGIYGAVRVAGDSVFVGSADGTLTCVGLESGSLYWKVSFEQGIHGAPCLCGSVLIVGSLSGVLYGIDPADGTVVWQYRTGGQVRSSPVAVGSTVVVGSYDTYVYAVDAGSGELRWRFCAGSPVYSSPCTDTSLVYVGANDGTFLALGTGLPGGQ